MIKNLVIVESPAKAKTIEKFLGNDYKVMSSYGHIRDLKKKAFSIDVDDNFKPSYEVPVEKKELVEQLKKTAEQAETVWLASDEDREGEAISWHLFIVLKLDPKRTKRIVFHEITKNAILEAIKHPREIDTNLVNAQQARRVLDRIVGFELSPVLWKRVKPALSAGRVQSVAVRLIVEREREINAYTIQSAYKVTAQFFVLDADGKKVTINAELNKRFENKKDAETFLNDCANAQFKIEDITKKPVKRSPASPFTTSTLQQEAARKLGFSVSRTMTIAQHLYESGFITYMRTDSVNLSSLALGTCKEEIIKLVGEKYVKTRQYTTHSKGAQEAHEAIRPTFVSNETIEGTVQEKKLYDLIWKRTIASQMADAKMEDTIATIGIGGKEEKFIATGSIVIFDGFLRVYRESFDDEIEQDTEAKLPPLTIGKDLVQKSVTAAQRFTQHPPRYTEASLVRKLEELGIGRPSTYAPTISTIQQRSYVQKSNIDGTERSYNILELKKGQISDMDKTEITGTEKGKLLPTDIGIVVNDFLMANFPEIMDYNFTANVEQDFDKIAAGKAEWTKLMNNFYKSFHPLVDKSINTKGEHKVGERMLGNDPKTEKPVYVKIGKFGPVLQLGAVEDKEKPTFAPLPKGISMDTVTLEMALDAFKLPRLLGQQDGKDLIVGIGRFGPFVRLGNTFVSVPETIDPMDITMEEGLALLQAKKEAAVKKQIKIFAEDPDLQILNGRFGPYISYKKENYKIPKNMDPVNLTLEDCHHIIETPKKAKSIRSSQKRKATAKKK
ncbi:MAG: type I DNA topoisomerase [Phocaeicola sp.]|uniref:type I DNA topoisomerase n=1 Tax=Phocaeicola sp. TaxID=2773926 RepID=UPI003F9F27D8